MRISHTLFLVPLPLLGNEEQVEDIGKILNFRTPDLVQQK